jgi:hypothetical protein
MGGRFSALKDRLGGGSERQPPKVVFATGGSGTRAIAEVMAEAGVYLGPELNRALDSLVLKPFLKGRSQEYLAESQWVEAVERGEPAAEPPAELVSEMRAGLERMHEGIPSADAMWGWKNPRTTNFLPILRALEPEAATAHLIRDGRDMAFSKNQNQLGDAPTLVPDELRDAPIPVQSVALWSRINLAAISYLEAKSPGGHLVIRYEDLCADPATHCEKLLNHLGIPVTDAVLQKARDSVKLSSSAGRWKQADPAELEAVLRAGEPALSRFGYV